MKIVVSSLGSGVDAAFSPVFGRCPVYVFVDSETMTGESAMNEASSASGGAGIQAAQYVVGQGAGAVITGSVGPNAFNVLSAAGIPTYVFNGATVRDAVEAFKAGKLAPVPVATGPAHGGMGMARGGGRGMGGGHRMGMSGAVGASQRLFTGSSPQEAGLPKRTASEPSDKLAGLKAEFQDLQAKLGKLAGEIERLEKGS